jgi:hypothetical protein
MKMKVSLAPACKHGGLADRRTILMAGACAALICASSAPVAAATSYAFTTLNAPNSLGTTEAYGINDAGQVVGYFGVDGAYQGFVESGGTFTTLDAGPNETEPAGINNAGEVVGSFFNGGAHGFIESHGEFTILTAPADPYATFAYGINNSDVVVGFNFYDSFVESGGVYTVLHDPEAEIYGVSDSTLGNGINDAGDIVGSFADASGIHGFTESGGVYTTLDVPAASRTFALGINNAGEVVGQFLDGSGEQHGFYTTLDEPDALPGDTFVEGVNDSGDVVGFFYTSSGIYGFVATPIATTDVPESSTWAMLLVGFAGLGLAGLRGSRRSFTSRLSRSSDRVFDRLNAIRWEVAP